MKNRKCKKTTRKSEFLFRRRNYNKIQIRNWIKEFSVILPKIHIQELNSKIDNLIAEKDDMIEYKDYYVHVILDFIKRF